MSAHTPGPWAIEPEWAEKRAGGTVAIVNREHSGDDWDVCEVHSTEANARLIAAAPELLEAAQFVLAYLNGHKCINNEEQRAVLEAAIAKATGGQP